jgi:hypothetical protein
MPQPGQRQHPVEKKKNVRPDVLAQHMDSIAYQPARTAALSVRSCRIG